MKKPSKEEISDLLTSLGSTEEEVANTLISLGIRGDKWKCGSCPIAKYMISKGVKVWVGADPKFGLGVTVNVNSYWYFAWDYPQLLGVRDFILSFDTGKFPQCER